MGANGNFKNLTGMVFNKLTVISLSKKVSNKGERYWYCRCECGNKCEVKGTNLIKGRTTSCGCNKKGIHVTHGMTNSTEYTIWTELKRRCNRSNHKDYVNYGGRGIRVCKRWEDSYTDFFIDMGKRPEGTTLDRIDNEGDYCKENCRWATLEEQHNNTRVNHYLTFNGETKTIAQWSREKRISEDAIQGRLKKGKTIEEVLRVREKNLFYYGDVGKTLMEWSKETGIPYRVLWVRITYQGWSLEKTLFTPVEPRKKRNENKKT